MRIVNIVKSIQGLDMATAINLQLVRDVPEASCVTVLHMESPCIRVHKCAFLLSALDSVSDEIITVGRSRVYEDLDKISVKCRIKMFLPLSTVNWIVLSTWFNSFAFPR